MQPTTFGLWLKKLRAEQDLTQEMLSELVGCATTTLRAFEIGTRRPSHEMVARIVTVLKVPVEQRAEFLRLARLPIDATRAAQPDEQGKAELPAPPTPAATGLPQSATPLIGRQTERDLLQALFVDEHCRLVTIVGAGGMGKTRLALDVAALLTSHFSAGAIFVPLAPLRTAAHLPGAIANAMQLALGSGDPSEQVLTALVSRHLLLVLDNFEELLHDADGAAVAWVNRLLQRAPSVQILITSRERLRLKSERLFELGGLSLPTATTPPEMSDAVLLFLERAQQITPDFRLDSSNIMAVTRICQLLDGMPLGIELAAAWVNILAPQEIADELASNIDFLARAHRDATPRHRSMKAVFDHSWALLNSEERAILGRLAVFRGGCQRDAAQTVAKATLPLLAGLIDKSLVRRRQTERQARYELHEVIRQYAGEKRRAATAGTADDNAPSRGLEQDEVWLAHYTYFCQLAATARTHLSGREQLHWLHILDEEHANLRAALDRCLRTQDFARGLQLAIQLEEYWYIRGHHQEGLQRLLEFLPQMPVLLPESIVARGYVTATILAIAGGNYNAAATYLARCLDAVRQAGDQALLARILRYAGLIALHEAAYAKAEALASEALQVALAIDNYSEVATTLSHLAEIAMMQQDYARAQEFGERAVQTLRVIEDKNQLAGSLRRLVQIHVHQGEWEAARREALESLALNNELGDQRGTAASIVIVTLLLAAKTQWAAVAQLLGAAYHLLTRSQASLLPADQFVYDEMWQLATAQCPDFSAQYEIGQTFMAQEQRPPYPLGWIYQRLA